MKKGIYIATLVVVVIAIAAAVYFAQNKSGGSADVVWDMPTPYGADTHQTQMVIEFAGMVNEASNGKLHINVHPGGKLIAHADIVDSVKSNQSQIGEVFMARMSSLDPIFRLDNIPFLATSYNGAESLFAASKPELEKQLDEEGLMMLYSAAWPAQSLYTNKWVNTMNDLKGLKMRVYSPSTTKLSGLISTQAVEVDFADIATAFKAGKVDAMITSPSTGVSNKSWEYLEHFNNIQAWIPKNIVFVNKQAFQQLDADTQAVIKAAGEKMQKESWDRVRKVARKDIETLKDNKIMVTEPTRIFRKDLASVAKIMTDEWVTESGQTGKDIVNKYLKRR